MSMNVRPVGRGTSSAVPQQPLGVSAQLADARSRLRSATPPGSWDAVLEEVQRLREERGVSQLAALQIVYGRLAAGWVPLRRR
jgi:hypothetical protein